MVKVVLLGANGLLGQALEKVRPEGVALVMAPREILDVRDPDALPLAFRQFVPDVVINCAAYTKVDAAEEEPGATMAWQVNALGARNVARACRDVGARLIHLSTDYVFGGRGGFVVFEPNQQPNPINVYGWTKFAGERFVQEELGSRALIVRTSSLFGGDRDFPGAILRQYRSDGEVRVVNDQVMSPTSAADLADRLFELATGGASGIQHVTNSGRCSWWEFAREIVKLDGGDPEKVLPMTSNELNRAAKRPLVSVLYNDRPMRPWQEALLAATVKREVAV